MIQPPAQAPAEPGTRQRVLMVAARLFRTQGYAATPLRDIASAAGMKAGSLYNHFSSKEEIVVEILNLGVQTAFDKVRASVERLGAAPCRTVLRAAIFAHLTCLLGEDNFTSANIRIFAHVPPHMRDATMSLRHGYERYWVEVLKRCAAEGALRPDIDPRMLSMFLFGAGGVVAERGDAAGDVGPNPAQDKEIFLEDGFAAAVHAVVDVLEAGRRGGQPSRDRSTAA
jgi:AcrR family transcriptional regulator